MAEERSGDRPFVSGQVLSSYVNYVRKKRGAEGYRRLADAMSFDVGNVQDARDYPVEYSHAVMDFLAKEYGDLEVFQLGRFCLSNVGAKRYFALILPPDKLLERLAVSLNKISNTTQVDYALTSEGADITMTLAEMAPHLQDFWKGMFQGIYDLTKTKGEIEYAGPGKKTGTYVYRMKWK